MQIQLTYTNGEPYIVSTDLQVQDVLGNDFYTRHRILTSLVCCCNLLGEKLLKNGFKDKKVQNICTDGYFHTAKLITIDMIDDILNGEEINIGKFKILVK